MYGQQITVQEQMQNNPSVFNNTSERFLLQNRIPLTLIMDPHTHFNKLNTSLPTHPDNSYTEFKITLGRDIIVQNVIPANTVYNTFGQEITPVLPVGSIKYVQNNGTYKAYVYPDDYDPSNPTPLVAQQQTHNISGTTLKIDRIYDVYIESITTFNAKLNNTDRNKMAFVLQINDWNIDNNTNINNMSRSVIIPNEATGSGTTIHKGKKLNYLTHLTPDSIASISGKISCLDNTSIFNDSATSRLSIELVLIPRNKN